MNNEDKIKDLFKDKLGQLESPVNPELWNAIASQIGTATAASVASVGMSLLSKLLIGVSAASIIGVGAYYLSKEQITQPTQNQTEEMRVVEKEAIDSDVQETVLPSTNDSQKEDLAVTNNNKLDQTKVVETKTGVTTEIKSDVKQQNSTDLSDNKTYTNEPNPNLIGVKPAPINSQSTKNSTTKENSATTKPTTSTVVELTNESNAPSFELTNLPNIYVLNASGYFSIGYKGEYTDFQFTLMDNANNVIFSSDQPDFEWRGTDKFNATIQPGDYIYIITVKDKNGKFINKYNTLKVINQ